MCFRGDSVSGVWSKTILLDLINNKNLDPSLRHMMVTGRRYQLHLGPNPEAGSSPCPVK